MNKKPPPPVASREEINVCRHGFPPLPEGDKSDVEVSKIVDSVARGDIRKVEKEMVWNPVYQESNDQMQQVAICMGIDQLLQKKRFQAARSHAKTVCAIDMAPYHALSELEQAGQPQKLVDYYKNLEELDSDRNIVRFFSRRIQCSCLDELKKQENTKEGKCSGCGKTKLWVELFDCKRCMITKYCGKKCQTKHWEDHKSNCTEIHRQRQSARFVEQLHESFASLNLNDEQSE